MTAPAPPTSHVPPHDLGLEKAVLGTLLTSPAGLRTTLALLRTDEAVFHADAHRVLYRAVLGLHAAGLSVDHLSLLQRLSAEGTLPAAGGADYVLTHLLPAAGPVERLDTYCRFLLEQFTRRQVVTVAHTLLSRAYDPMQDVFALLGEAGSAVNGLHDTLHLKRPTTVGQHYDAVIDQLKRATQQPDGLTGVPSGLPSLDKVTGGWQAPDLVIIAARPAMGKTSLALFMARYAAGHHYPAAFFSLEMSTEQLVRKLIATEAGYTTAQLQRGKLAGGAAEAEDIRLKAAALRHAGLVIDDTPALRIGEFRAKAAKLVAEYGVRLLVVDYLQLMSGETRGSREQEISSISRGLKLAAKELGVPVLALSQLSRDVEKRGGEKKPQLSDLRESGAIEQDADVIVFPYRPEYYGITEDELGMPTAGTTELLIAKHRNGSLAELVVGSDMSQGRYYELSAPAPPVQPFDTSADFPRPLRPVTASDFDPADAPDF